MVLLKDCILFLAPCPTNTETIICGKRRKLATRICRTAETKNIIKIVSVQEKTTPIKKASRGCAQGVDYDISDTGYSLWTKGGCVANFTVEICDLEGNTICYHSHTIKNSKSPQTQLFCIKAGTGVELGHMKNAHVGALNIAMYTTPTSSFFI